MKTAVSAISNSLGALALAATCAGAFAQVLTDDAKVGTMLTASGVKMNGLFAKSLPLPPGNWLILGRTDSAIKLSQSVSQDISNQASAKEVSLTLLNKDAASPIVAAVLTYTPEQMRIRWMGAMRCANGSAAFVDDFGTTAGSIQYGCANSYYHGKDSFKRYILSVPTSNNQWFRDRFTPFVAVADQLPDAYIWNFLTVSMDRGRRASIFFILKAAPDLKVGDQMDVANRSWINATGKAYMAWTDNDEKPVPAFPSQ